VFSDKLAVAEFGDSYLVNTAELRIRRFDIECSEVHWMRFRVVLRTD